jgi:endoglucanase
VTGRAARAVKSVLDPNGTGCLNLSGGFHNAGDHVKFGLPQSYAASVLGWGMYEFPQAYQQTGTWNHALDEMKWFSDYFLRSVFLNSSGQVVAFAYQVGEGSVDHDYWGRRSCRARPSTRGRPISPPPKRPPRIRPSA